jgi:hypothetical protein
MWITKLMLPAEEITFVCPHNMTCPGSTLQLVPVQYPDGHVPIAGCPITFSKVNNTVLPSGP